MRLLGILPLIYAAAALALGKSFPPRGLEAST